MAASTIGGVEDDTDLPPDDDAPSDNSGKQPTELEDQELFQRLKGWYQEDYRANGKWRKKTRESYGFYSNDQWEPEDVATLREQLRPVITFNRIAPVIDTVAGMEVNNRQEIHCYPRNPGAAQLNETLTNAVKWVRDDCDAEDEESDAFIDVLIGGVATVEYRLDVDRDPQGMLLVERFDPLEAGWDAYARKRNLTDRRRCWRRREIDIADAKAMFPDAEESDLHAVWAEQHENESDEPHDATEAKWYRDDQSGRDGEPRRKKVTIVQMQWFERETSVKTVNPMTGELETLEPGAFKKIAARIKAATGHTLPSVKQTKRVYKQAFLGRVVLESGNCPCKEDFTFQFITGKRDRNNKSWYGIVEAMKDPQRWANKFFATILHNIATQGKGIIAEQGAFTDARKAESDWSRPDAIVWAKDGALAANRIIPKPSGQLPTGLSDMLTFALGSLRDVSGVNLETLGQADRDQPASLEWQRRKSAFSILAGYFDALRHYRKAGGRVLIWMIQEYISDGRLMRVQGEDGSTQYQPLNRDPSVTDYDVIVDDAPSSPDQKETTWMILQGMMPFLIKLPGIPMSVWMEFLKSSPLPESVTTKIIGLLQKQAEQPPPPDPKVELIQAQIASLQAKDQIAASSAQQKSQQQAEEHQQDLQHMQAEAQLEHQQQIDQAQSETAIEGARLQHDLAIEETKADNAMELERMKANSALQIEREKADVSLDIKKQEFAEKKRQGAYKPQPKGKK